MLRNPLPTLKLKFLGRNGYTSQSKNLLPSQSCLFGEKHAPILLIII